LKSFPIKATSSLIKHRIKKIRKIAQNRGYGKCRSPASASPTFSDSFIKNFRQKENKNGSLSYFYKDRAPYSADPKFFSHKNKAREFRSKERRVKRRIICIKCVNDCLLRSAGLNSPAGGEKKKNREEKKKTRDFLQQSCDAKNTHKWTQTRIPPDKIQHFYHDAIMQARADGILLQRATAFDFFFLLFELFCSLE